MTFRLRRSDGLLAGFLALAVVVALIGTNSLELELSLAMQRLDAADAWFRAASRLGGEPINVVAPIVAIVVLAAIGWSREAAFMFGSVIGSTVLQHGIKLVIGRTRPMAPVRLEAITTGSSFPSGHVMEYVALLGFAIVIVRARLRPSTARTLLSIALIVPVCAVGPSRVYLGAHWTTDVIGAYLIGGWWLAVCARGYHGTLGRG